MTECSFLSSIQRAHSCRFIYVILSVGNARYRDKLEVWGLGSHFLTFFKDRGWFLRAELICSRFEPPPLVESLPKNTGAGVRRSRRSTELEGFSIRLPEPERSEDQLRAQIWCAHFHLALLGLGVDVFTQHFCNMNTKTTLALCCFWPFINHWWSQPRPAQRWALSNEASIAKPKRGTMKNTRRNVSKPSKKNALFGDFLCG